LIFINIFYIIKSNKIGIGGEKMALFGKIKAEAANAIFKASEKEAKKSVNSACGWFQYQPKCPAALKKSGK